MSARVTSQADPPDPIPSFSRSQSRLVGPGDDAVDGAGAGVATSSCPGPFTEVETRLAALEAQNARQVQFIHSMHSWAGKTADTLRQMHRRCGVAEAAAEAAQRDSAQLRRQMQHVTVQQATAVGRMREVEDLLQGLLEQQEQQSGEPSSPEAERSGRKRRRINASACTGDSLNETPGQPDKCTDVDNNAAGMAALSDRVACPGL